MYGRFAVAIPKKFTSFLGVDLSLLKILRTPRYNVSPSQEILVFTEQKGEVSPVTMPWGYPPPEWMTGFTKKVINARSESIDTKPMFRDSFARRRCLVLASGILDEASRIQG
jgi:putative SOS response-associated peptidase YedK